jgi:CRP/FNR family transcriptional regulator, dissimilatory nitrate respiration regulator
MIVIMLEYLLNLPNSLRTYRKGQYLFHQGDTINEMFLVQSGEARLIRRHQDGNVVVLQRATTGSVLAEASLFSSVYHCDAMANTRLFVRLIPRSKIKTLFESNAAFASSWAGHLADEVRNARLRAEILSLKTVSERLSAWIANTGSLPAKGSWKAVAQEIGTSPEALYREIATRKLA